MEFKYKTYCVTVFSSLNPLLWESNIEVHQNMIFSHYVSSNNMMEACPMHEFLLRKMKSEYRGEV